MPYHTCVRVLYDTKMRSTELCHENKHDLCQHLMQSSFRTPRWFVRSVQIAANREGLRACTGDYTYISMIHRQMDIRALSHISTTQRKIVNKIHVTFLITYYSTLLYSILFYSILFSCLITPTLLFYPILVILLHPVLFHHILSYLILSRPRSPYIFLSHLIPLNSISCARTCTS